MNRSINNVNDAKRIARTAGLWYLLLGITSGYSWMYITKIFAVGNASLTVNKILGSETEYFVSIAGSIAGQISFVLLALTLFRLLRHIHELQAGLMLAFVLVSVPIMFVNLLFQTGVLIVLHRVEYLAVFSSDQLSAIAMLLLHLSTIGVHIAGIFWGLWLFPLGSLVYKSEYFPAILAVLLMISGTCYLIGSISSLMVPALYTEIEKYLSAPEALGELAMVFWLLIKGINTPKAVVNS
jgi:hypothetical protein